MLSSPSKKTHCTNLIKLARHHHQSGRLQEAEDLYRQVLASSPGNFDALYLLGVLMLQTGHSDLAADLIGKAVKINNKDHAAFNHLGVACRALGRHSEAETCYRKSLRLHPDYVDAHYNLGNLLCDLKRFKESEKAFRSALSLREDYAEAYSNLGFVLLELNRPEEALEACQKALEHRPDYAKAYCNIGYAHQDLRRFQAAETAYRKALELKPDYDEVQQNLAMLRLVQGDFEQGFRLFEQRFNLEDKREIKKTVAILDYLNGRNIRRWQGEALAGLSLLIITEQGAGDSLMMMRYVPLLTQLGLKRLVIYCETPLRRVFQCVSGSDDVVAMSEALPTDGIDRYCMIMSLPFLFNTRPESIPATVPYLPVPEEIKTHWRKAVINHVGLKVGLVWAGGKLTRSDSKRSIPLDCFAPLLELQGVQFFSLQKDRKAGQQKRLGKKLIDYMDRCEDFLDTAGLVDQLDLIISVDTSIAHLAGALGKPVWLLNRYEHEWRWLLDREDSPWYPTMKIFKQQVYGDWDQVIKRVLDGLTALMKNSCRDAP